MIPSSVVYLPHTHTMSREEGGNEALLNDESGVGIEVSAPDQMETNHPAIASSIGNKIRKKSNKKSWSDDPVQAYMGVRRYTKRLLWFFIVVSFCCLIMLIIIAITSHEVSQKERIHLLAIVMPIFVISNAFLFVAKNDIKVLITAMLFVSMVIGYIISSARFVLTE